MTFARGGYFLHKTQPLRQEEASYRKYTRVFLTVKVWVSVEKILNAISKDWTSEIFLVGELGKDKNYPVVNVATPY